MTALHDLYDLGQSIWYDNIRRKFIEDGTIQGLIDSGVVGVTSNPSIFEKAIAGSSDYDAALQALVNSGTRSVNDLYEALALEDIGNTADLFRPVYDQTNGLDGYVSIEVSPNLANDTEQTIAEARRLFRTLNRPNIMIKVPGTAAGIPAIQTLIGDGINVNVTLLFAVENYRDVAGAYMRGLEALAADGGDLSKVASVASFFVSRVDTAVDKALQARGNTDLQGKSAIANAKVSYALYHELYSSDRWQALAAQGARPQRLLWASTSTKNPAYPDTLYVDTLIGPDTVNTVPPETLDAYLDHGVVAAPLGTDLAGAQAQLAALADLGINLDAVTDQLQIDGVAAFAKSFESLMNTIADKYAALQTEVSLG